MVGSCVSFVRPKIPILRGFCSVQKSNILLFCPVVLPFGFSQNFRLNNTRRVVRVVEGAALEMLCSLKEPRVRIPNSPPSSRRVLVTRRIFMRKSGFVVRTAAPLPTKPSGFVGTPLSVTMRVSGLFPFLGKAFSEHHIFRAEQDLFFGFFIGRLRFFGQVAPFAFEVPGLW